MRRPRRWLTGPSATRLLRRLRKLAAQADWLDDTIAAIIISEAQNEVADFKKWGFDIIPHRARIKQGFETADGQRVDVETAFKDPDHPFRVAIVCAMWMTGFDVECLSTLYIDKPMKEHTLMQAIARANRVYPGKDFGLIVDYNGILKKPARGAGAIRVGRRRRRRRGDRRAHRRACAGPHRRPSRRRRRTFATSGSTRRTLLGSTGFARIKSLKDAVEAVYASDEAKRRFELLARQVFVRFRALLTEPSAIAYAERHDNIEAVYKKLTERRDTADVTELLKELHRIVQRGDPHPVAG